LFASLRAQYGFAANLAILRFNDQSANIAPFHGRELQASQDFLAHRRRLHAGEVAHFGKIVRRVAGEAGLAANPFLGLHCACNPILAFDFAAVAHGAAQVKRSLFDDGLPEVADLEILAVQFRHFTRGKSVCFLGH
jgi:hypothetical protein